MPTLVGLAALATAGAGMVAVAHTAPRGDRLQLSAGAQRSGDADQVTGSRMSIGDAAIAAARATRAQTVSRDSQRQALGNTADQELQSAADAMNRERSSVRASLARAAVRRARLIAQKENTWGLPTRNYHLTAGFGQVSGLWSSFHTGLDFAAPTGTPIFAVADGVITRTGWAGAYGYRTVERLVDGTRIWYAHQNTIRVHTGQTVSRGQTIGAVGATGNTTGPHLHLEVRPRGHGPVDPYPALVQHGVQPRPRHHTR